MTGRGPLDRAATWLGVASLLSAVFRLVDGDLQFVRIQGGGLAVALGLGVVACGAGWLSARWLAVAAGGGYLLAASVLLALLPDGGGFLDGDGSTFSLWLGLGVALVVVGLTRREA